ncbi:hypothetical protein [Georgenia alba]|uniref:Linocin/CFP29 family protein n=1 Tax=Georgenia alba TaxID=2233858 RepID=A0ABW2Q3B6_9MICO
MATSEWTGEIGTYLAAMGGREGDAAVDRAIALAGGALSANEYNIDVPTKYVASEGGTEFMFEDGVLHSVLLHGPGSQDGAYPRPSALIDGLSLDSGREQLEFVLGEPHRSTPGYVKYKVGDCFVNFTFADDVVKDVQVQRTDVGADAPVAPAPAPEAEISGELATIMAALGTEYGSREMGAVVLLTGPNAREHAMEDGKAGRYVTFGDSGVDLLYRNDRLVGATVYVSGEERDLYPRPEKLIDGLRLPARRMKVNMVLGSPTDRSSDIDLYSVGEIDVMFDYADKYVRTISVAMPGAQAE